MWTARMRDTPRRVNTAMAEADSHVVWSRYDVEVRENSLENMMYSF